MPKSALSEVLPVFPLTGSLLLPGNFLPLNVFEPRYRNMVRDALGGDRHIGMIQPRTPRPDNWGPIAELGDHPELYSVGCCGRIEQCDRQPDGRYVIVLKGVTRFRIRNELPVLRGYRRVQADYAEFSIDSDASHPQIDRDRLLSAVEDYSRRHDLEFDLDLLLSLPPLTLVNALSAALPFAPAEKQALLEAPAPEDREALLLTLMGMALRPEAPQHRYSPPPIN